MEIVKLPPGIRASVESDCISIQQADDGSFILNGSLLVRCGEGAELDESLALIGGDAYASYAEAEAAGMAWASEHCVERLHVSRSDGTKPLPELP